MLAHSAGSVPPEIEEREDVRDERGEHCAVEQRRHALKLPSASRSMVKLQDVGLPNAYFPGYPAKSAPRAKLLGYAIFSSSGRLKRARNVYGPLVFV
jgi:hypothetical protein